MPSRTTLPPGLCICGDAECKIQYGECHCGCGKKTRIADMTSRLNGAIMGYPKRFVALHFNKSLKMSLSERYWRQVDKDGPTIRPELGPCWKWMGAVTSKGYGVTGEGGKNIIASRASWIVNRGPIPNGKFVLHRCDNPPCTNPEHLFLGTKGDNWRDALQKGRRKLKPPSTICAKGHTKPSGKRCPTCMEEYVRQYDETHRDELNAKNRKWYQDHRDEIVARRRELKRKRQTQ